MIKRAYDAHKSIAETLSATIASSGIDEVTRKYHEFKIAQPAAYNFDESELNALGYQLIQTKQFHEAIQVFQLNVEAYPQSSNVYDSLAEAYMDAGNKPQAMVYYQKSLDLDPKNRNAAEILRRLNTP
jgi:Flp pilus assembly protein TadD